MRRSCITGAVLALLCVCGEAHAGGDPLAAEPHALEPLPAPTFYYTTPAEPRPLRGVAEFVAVFTLGFAWYATTAPTVHRWDPGYRYATFESKLTLKDFGPDANAFGTNFIGHPLGGTGYYLSARANRLSTPVSFALAVAGSFMWEMFGEVSEVVSMNDMIVTPLGGVAIGEATTQLAAFLDRSAPTTGNRVLGAFFGPFKTLNDAFDGLEPDRSSAGSDFHRFRAEAAVTFVREDVTAHSSGQIWPEGRATLASEIVRVPGYAGAGHGRAWFDDANASNLELRAAAGAAGLTDLAFTSEVVLAGGYYRARALADDGGAWGSSGLGGVTTGFQYTLHQYRRQEGRRTDRISTVQPLGLRFQQRASVGGPVLTSELAFGPDFGGITPNAIATYRGTDRQLPFVQVERGYYFGVGAHGRARFGFEQGPVFARAELSVLGLRSVRGPHDEPGPKLADALARYVVEGGYRARPSAFAPRVFLERRLRLGWVGSGHVTSGEFTLGLGLGADF